MSNIFDDGVVVHRKIKEYQSAHPGTSYDGAYRALMREEEAREQENRDEFSRRVTAYSSEFPDDGNPAELVAKHDPNMIAAYADTGDMPTSMGDVMAAAKQAVAASKVRLDVAVMRILRSERDVAKKVAGDWMDHAARTAVNNLNLGGDMSRSYPVALRLVSRKYPEVDQQYQNGTVTALSMKTIFWPWFKD